MNPDELTAFSNDHLLALARNEAAESRTDAIRLLLERGSPLAYHPSILSETKKLALDEAERFKKLEEKLEWLRSDDWQRFAEDTGQVHAIIFANQQAIAKLEARVTEQDEKIRKLERTAWERLQEKLKG